MTVPRATKVMATGLMLAWVAAGCASSPAATGASPATCYRSVAGHVLPGRSPRPRRGAGLNFAHLGLALAGLVVWISYLGTDLTGLAWAGCGLLLAVASLGMTLVFLGPATATAAGPTVATSAAEPTAAEPTAAGSPRRNTLPPDP